MPFRCQQNWILFKFRFGKFGGFFLNVFIYTGKTLFKKLHFLDLIYNLDINITNLKMGGNKKSYLGIQIFLKSSFYCTYLEKTHVYDKRMLPLK